MGVCVCVRERERYEDIETGERKSKYNTKFFFSAQQGWGESDEKDIPGFKITIISFWNN